MHLCRDEASFLISNRGIFYTEVLAFMCPSCLCLKPTITNDSDRFSVWLNLFYFPYRILCSASPSPGPLTPLCVARPLSYMWVLLPFDSHMSMPTDPCPRQSVCYCTSSPSLASLVVHLAMQVRLRSSELFHFPVYLHSRCQAYRYM